MKTLYELELKTGANIFDLQGTEAFDLNTKVVNYDGWNIELETTVNIFEEEFKVSTEQSHLDRKDYDRIIKNDELWKFDDMASADVKAIEISEELANRLIEKMDEALDEIRKYYEN